MSVTSFAAAQDGHFMGGVMAVEFTSYEATLEKFQQEGLEIVKGLQGKKS